VTKSYRGAVCTSTFISGNGAAVLVDPPFEAARLAEVLHARTGKTLAEITHVYITHGHGDHFMALDCFPNASIYAAPDEIKKVIENCEQRDGFTPGIIPAKDGFIPGISVIHIPGHTMGICGLLFDAAEGKVAVVGDAIMTRDFFAAREGYHNSVDFTASTRSIELIADIADIVVPGHDNYFLTGRNLSR